MSESEVENRLFNAYFRRFSKKADQPSSLVDWIEYENRDYAVLTNVNGILAVYRVKKDGGLKFINQNWFENAIWNRLESDEKLMKKLMLCQKCEIGKLTTKSYFEMISENDFRKGKFSNTHTVYYMCDNCGAVFVIDEATHKLKEIVFD